MSRAPIRNGAICKQPSEALVVFQGDEHYISPSWYATKRETGKVVPTWNYLMVQARGRPRVIEDADWLRAQIEALTQRRRRRAPRPGRSATRRRISSPRRCARSSASRSRSPIRAANGRRARTAPPPTAPA